MLVEEVGLTGSGSATVPTYDGTGDLLVYEVLLSGAAEMVPPNYDASGALLVEVIECAGAATFYLSLEGIFADPSFPSAFG
jgi:hypothetical protein